MAGWFVESDHGNGLTGSCRLRTWLRNLHDDERETAELLALRVDDLTTALGVLMEALLDREVITPDEAGDLLYTVAGRPAWLKPPKVERDE